MTDDRLPPEAELTRLADGSLNPDREADLRAQVDRSPELRAQLAEQERAVAMLRALDTPAPDALRTRVQALTAGRGESGAGTRGRRWPARGRFGRALVLPAATALAVVVAALVILVSGSGSPTVSQTAQLALARATLPAPAVNPADPTQLRVSGAGIPFPRLAPWTVVGARQDRIDGRTITTVFYRDPATGARVGYAITSGSALAGTRGTGYDQSSSLGRTGSARLITWVQSGHTCVIAGRAVDGQTLLRLAELSHDEA
jgi:anti-sigma factor RsiW